MSPHTPKVIEGPLETPLSIVHREKQAKMVEFAGWSMPIQYPTGILQEHRAVREQAGIFDIGHMGLFKFTGEKALDLLESIFTNSVATLPEEHCAYGLVCNEAGTVLDDIMIYRMPKHYLMVANASNAKKIGNWMAARNPGAEITNMKEGRDAYTLLALQGPKSLEILKEVTTAPIEGMKFRDCIVGDIMGIPAYISRTGYTGEFGYEFFFRGHRSEHVWNMLMEAGKPLGLMPAGLGARDTLRLEAGLPLYGHELDEQHTPFESGLGFAVKLDKGPFIGRDALAKQKESGIPNRLIGFEAQGRLIPRQGFPILSGGRPVGAVTSGTFGPTTQKPIGMARVETASADASDLAVDIRGQAIPITVLKIPFIKRTSPLE